MSFSIASAQINLDANSINFRNYDDADHATYHYGDLFLEGGASGYNRGGLRCYRIANYGDIMAYGCMYIYGTKHFVNEREEPKELNPVKQRIKGIAEKAMKMNKKEKNRK